LWWFAGEGQPVTEPVDPVIVLLLRSLNPSCVRALAYPPK
jgi:hypothetical protein